MILYLDSSGVECCLKIHPPEKVTLLPGTHLLPRLRKIKLRPTAQSEGYETMTQGSSDITSQVKNFLFTIDILTCNSVLDSS